LAGGYRTRIGAEEGLEWILKEGTAI